MSYSVVSSDSDPFISNERANQTKKSLENFTKLMTGRPDLLDTLCEIRAMCGSKLDGECCKPVDKNTIMKIGDDVVQLLTSGKMKVNGNRNNWSNGCFGSIWIDMDAKMYDVDYIRCAFYSKATFKGVWPTKKNYLITVTVEKANRGK